jgi:hypothetical protein
MSGARRRLANTVSAIRAGRGCLEGWYWYPGVGDVSPVLKACGPQPSGCARRATTAGARPAGRDR